MERKERQDAVQLVTAEQISSITSIPVRTVYRLAQEGLLPAVRFGRRIVRFNLAEVIAHIESQARSAPQRSRSTVA